MTEAVAPRPLSTFGAVNPAASLILLVALACFLFGDAGALGPNQVAVAVATLIAVAIGAQHGHSLESLGKAATNSVATGIAASFRVTPWLFIPPGVVVILALFKFPPFTTIFIGALVGGAMAVVIAS